MTPDKSILNSHASFAKPPGHPIPTSVTRYPADDGHRPWLVFLIILLVIGGAAFALGEPSAQTQASERQYHITDLPSLGGTVSRGNSINNRDWIAGYSTQPGNETRHAALWREGIVTDLGTLGGPNSTVAWPVKKTAASSSALRKPPRPSRSVKHGAARRSTADRSPSATSRSASHGRRERCDRCQRLAETTASPPVRTLTD